LSVRADASRGANRLDLHRRRVHAAPAHFARAGWLFTHASSGSSCDASS
jgi:hypothetical protein